MNAQAALQTIQTSAPLARPRVALILGSGWGDVTKNVQEAVRIPYSALQGFPEPSVAGHGGELWLGTLGAHTVAVMSGRKHGYETGALDGMQVPLQVLQALGCEVLVQTNAAGSLRLDLPALSLMVLSDHINLPQRSPLVEQGGSSRFRQHGRTPTTPTLRVQALVPGRTSRGCTLHEAVCTCLGFWPAV
jgi:purine-nucleoside phosphorylase